MQRKSSGMQMLRDNRDDDFLGDASPVTKPGNFVKFAGASAASDMHSFYDGLKLSSHGANNGHLHDGTAQPNRAIGEYHGETSSKARGDINSYFSLLSSSVEKGARASSDAVAMGGKGMAADAAETDINGYFKGMTPKVKHVAGKLDPQLDASSASKDIIGFFNSLAKGKHGINNGHLRAKNSHAAPAKVSASTHFVCLTAPAASTVACFYGGLCTWCASACSVATTCAACVSTRLLPPLSPVSACGSSACTTACNALRRLQFVCGT